MMEILYLIALRALPLILFRLISILKVLLFQVLGQHIKQMLFILVRLTEQDFLQDLQAAPLPNAGREQVVCIVW